MRVAMNGQFNCMDCGRVLMWKPLGKSYVIVPFTDQLCTDKCIIENAGKAFVPPTWDLQESE